MAVTAAAAAAAEAPRQQRRSFARFLQSSKRVGECGTGQGVLRPYHHKPLPNVIDYQQKLLLLHLATGCGSSWPQSQPPACSVSNCGPTRGCAFVSTAPSQLSRPQCALIKRNICGKMQLVLGLGLLAIKCDLFLLIFLFAFCKRAWARAQLLPTSRLPGLASAHCPPSTVHYLVPTVRSLLCESPSDAVVTLCTLLPVREPSSNHNATR